MLHSPLILNVLQKIARWLVPKMVKNGVKSYFVYWSLIWACLTDNSGRVERGQIRRFHQILKEAEFCHEQLRLQLASLELNGTQEHQKHVHTSRLSPDQKIGIMAILHQFRDKPARSSHSSFSPRSEPATPATRLCQQTRAAFFASSGITSTSCMVCVAFTFTTVY